MTINSKRDSCRHHHVSLDNRNIIHICNQGDTLSGPLQDIGKGECCNTCERYKSLYIEYPIQVDKINTTPIEPSPLYAEYIGKPCAVRLCRDDNDATTYIGIFLGELPYEMMISYQEDSKELHQYPAYNPAILIPEKKEIVWGYESWWKIINSPEDFTEISAADIQSQWYVQMWTNLFPK